MRHRTAYLVGKYGTWIVLLAFVIGCLGAALAGTHLLLTSAGFAGDTAEDTAR